MSLRAVRNRFAAARSRFCEGLAQYVDVADVVREQQYEACVQCVAFVARQIAMGVEQRLVKIVWRRDVGFDIERHPSTVARCTRRGRSQCRGIVATPSRADMLIGPQQVRRARTCIVARRKQPISVDERVRLLRCPGAWRSDEQRVDAR